MSPEQVAKAIKENLKLEVKVDASEKLEIKEAMLNPIMTKGTIKSFFLSESEGNK